MLLGDQVLFVDVGIRHRRGDRLEQFEKQIGGDQHLVDVVGRGRRGDQTEGDAQSLVIGAQDRAQRHGLARPASSGRADRAELVLVRYGTPVEHLGSEVQAAAGEFRDVTA
ncbi:hypothetical protein NG2371_01290 [Nocardia gamkensis]|nr:hypothetical protein [Nocardia gamkensis]